MTQGLIWLLVFIGGAPISGSHPSLVVSRIEISPRVLDVKSKQDVRIRFYLSSPDSVAIDIVDETGNSVWTQRRSFERGYSEFRWDGHTRAQKRVPPGVYQAILSPRSTESVDQTGQPGRTVSVYDITLDSRTGNLSFRLPEPARVEARFGVRDGGPLLRTVDLIQGPGQQMLHWDGWDQSHVTNMLGSKAILASVKATALPQNAIIVSDSKLPQVVTPAACQIRFRNQGTCKPGTKQRLLVAEIQAMSDDDSLLAGDRYEWMFFVDHRFVFEEEKVTTNPYVLELDVTPLASGEHVLTVNLAGQSSDFVQSVSGRFSIGTQEAKQ